MSLTEEELADLKAPTPRLETMNGRTGWSVGAHQLSAFASCAKQIGTSVEVVMRAVETDQLGALIQKRSGHIAERRNLLRGHLARTDMLIRRAELMRKQVPDW